VYQERQVKEHALRVPRSWLRWVRIISTMSWGTRQVDSCAVRVSGGSLLRRRLILALL